MSIEEERNTRFVLELHLKLGNALHWMKLHTTQLSKLYTELRNTISLDVIGTSNSLINDH